MIETALALAKVDRPIIALAGSQGSGKSTMAKAFGEARPDAAILSLDDFYLGKAERMALAERVHPMLAVRGVPGTHDVALLGETIAALRAGQGVRVPVFDKLADDRTGWRDQSPVAMVLVEGWCLGATPQDEAALAEPVNALERQGDPDGSWRRAVNARLASDYAALFAGFDALTYLRAPDFAQVVEWRSEQQETLLGRGLSDAERAEIAAFVAYYERITRHMLAGGIRAEITADLAPDRSIVALR